MTLRYSLAMVGMLALAGAHIHSLTEFSMALVESAGAHRPGQHG